MLQRESRPQISHTCRTFVTMRSSPELHVVSVAPTSNACASGHVVVSYVGN